LLYCPVGVGGKDTIVGDSKPRSGKGLLQQSHIGSGGEGMGEKPSGFTWVPDSRLWLRSTYGPSMSFVSHRFVG